MHLPTRHRDRCPSRWRVAPWVRCRALGQHTGSHYATGIGWRFGGSWHLFWHPPLDER